MKQLSQEGWELEDNNVLNPQFFEKNHEMFKHQGGDTETFLSKCKMVHSKRVFCKPESLKRRLTQEDIDAALILFKENKDDKNQQISDSVLRMYV